MSQYKGDFFLLIAAMIGGLGFVFIKYLLEWHFTPFQIIAGRFLIATLFLYVIYHKELRQITIREWKYGSILGILLFLLFVLMTLGLQYTTPSVNAFLTCLPAVIVPFILWGVFHTMPDRMNFITATMTMVGVALLYGANGIEGGIGIVLSLGASIAFAFQMAFMDRFLKKGNALHLALVEHTIVLTLSSILAVGQNADVPNITFSILKYFLLLGIFCTGTYFVLQSLGQQYTKPSKAAIILTLESVFACFASAVLYGERLNIRGYLGCIVIFCALILTELKPKQKMIENNS